MANKAINDLLKYNLKKIKLPTYASATEATNGIRGITIVPSASYPVIGRDTKLNNGYNIGTTATITIDFSNPKLITNFTYIRGGVTGTTFNAGLTYLDASINGSSWDRLYTGDGSSALTDYINTVLTLNTAYRFARFTCEVVYGGNNGRVGAINLTYLG